MNEPVHIVCLDAPSPPDYGGAMDIFHKVIAMATIGRKVILHYFDYNKERNTERLEKSCLEIHAYQRKAFLRSPSTLPYIVRSRINKELIHRLNQDSFPILLEGIHCSGILPHLNDQRRVVIRMHNEESGYYKNLALSEKNVFKRSYYELESRLLKKYYAKLSKKVRLACLSEADIAILQQQYQFEQLEFIPGFVPWKSIASKEGRGDYVLYHGNMSVSENEAAALWLVENVFQRLDINLIIAGKGISKALEEKTLSLKNISLSSNPTSEEMDDLIKNAHIHVLPSMNTTGVKFKLLHALFEGRFCITNTNGIKGSGIHAGIDLADNPSEYIDLIKKLFAKDFSPEDKKNRQQILSVYNNIANAEKLSAVL